MPRWKTAAPLIISVGIIAFLLWRISPGDLLAAMGEVRWAPIIAVTLALVLINWLLDGVCLWRLFSDPGRPLPYGTAVRSRGAAYLGTVLHFSAGQGVLAWLIARRQGRPLLPTVARFVVLVYIDGWMLFALGLLGATLSHDPRTHGIALFCTGGLAGLALLTLAAHRLPRRLTDRLKRSRYGAWMFDPELTWRRIAPLFLLRGTYFSFGITHAAAVLWICGVLDDFVVAISVVPIMSLVDALPISVSGLGTREATLLAFLRPERPAMLMAGTLLWWSTVIVGRSLLGLGCLWWPGGRQPTAEEKAALLGDRHGMPDEPGV